MKNGYQEYRPSVVFLNGQYWGIHNIREKMNDHYLESHYGIDINNIDLVEISKGIFTNNGDLTAYESMINFLSAQDMSLPENYEYIKSIVDTDNYVDYLCAQIYSANADWPGSNMKLWRERTPGSKWKWLFYDLDFTFGGNAKGVYYWNTLEVATAVDGPSWPNPPWSTLMVRKMLENTEFRNEFIQRFAVHMNTTFAPVHVNNVIDSLGAVIASEIPRHKERWYKSISMGQDWVENVQVMKDFAHLRQPEVRQHFYSKFNLDGSYTLAISRNNPSYGKIYTHNIEVKSNGSVNTFFRNIPLKIKAFPMPGYRFTRWEGASGATTAETEITLSSDSYLTAVFEPAELSVISPVINEINYKSSPSFNTDDWIELYNPVSEEVNLAGWKLRDINIENTYTFPEGAKIVGNGYLVMCRDKQKFSSLNMDIKNVYGNLEFGLSNDGEAVYLYDAHDNLIDYVEYGVSGDWPLLRSANGPTLSLKDPQADNALASSWMESVDYGTPGRLNDSYTKTEDESFEINEFSLANNYPNPFNPVTTIRYTVPYYKHIILKVVDVLGREIGVLVNEPKSPGIYEAEFNASGLPSGIYFYQLRAGDYAETKKMTLMK
jgi:hypothetical protein